MRKHVGELRVDLLFELADRFGARGAFGGAVLELGSAGEEELAVGIERELDAVVRLRHPVCLLFATRVVPGPSRHDRFAGRRQRRKLRVMSGTGRAKQALSLGSLQLYVPGCRSQAKGP